jgi:hypothetical protein
MSDPDLQEKLGDLRGRVVAVESRVERNETETRGTLAVIMDNKLDLIMGRLERSEGAKDAGTRFGIWLRTLIGVLIGGALSWIGHILSRSWR